MGDPHAWSYSMSETFKSCPRAWWLGETAQRRVQGRYLGTVTLASLAGQAVHQSISSEIGLWAQGFRIDVARAERAAEQCIRDAWAESSTRIREVRNGLSLANVSSDRFINYARARVRDFVRLVWPHFRSHVYVMHESNGSFRIGDVQVWVRVDLCTRGPGGLIVLTDWKTGRLGPGDVTGMQLGAYSLWARNHFSVTADRVMAQLVSLRTCEIMPRYPSDEELAGVQARILDEVEDWHRRRLSIDFPALPLPAKCLSCQFLDRCEEGQATLNAKSVEDLAGDID